jgi:carbon storage regulator
MLILTRKVDQGIVIQDNILVTVLRVDGDRVMIGISAPRDVTVLRQELLNQEGRRAATSPGQEPSGRETASV